MAYLEDLNQIWEMVRESFVEELSRTVTNLYMSKLKVLDMKDNEIIMSAENALKVRMVTLKYKSSIEKRFSEYLGFDVTVTLISAEPEWPNDDNESDRPDPSRIPSDPQKDAQPYSDPIPQPTQSELEQLKAGKNSAVTTIGSTQPPFNFEYTFDNFIVGNSNKFAHAACLAIAAHPAQSYNPLFIYGPSGLGKTHLLYAITNELKRKNENINVIYIKGEDFTNQLIESLSRQAMREFRDKYRSCDVLLIDDIQFIAGKTSTQEEFFYTFNALYENKKQIILTSDRPPREIKTLEDRLKTRFEWGLIADIQPPDLELRTAIIKKKVDQVNVPVDDEVIAFLAENLRSNIRQIEGAIKKLGAVSMLSGKHITMEVARTSVADLLGDSEPIQVTVDKIFSAIYKKYQIKKDDILSSKRTKEIAAARHVAIYLIRAVTEMSFPNIGKLINRDHTTVMSSVDTVEKRMTREPMYRVEIEEMVKDIKGV